MSLQLNTAHVPRPSFWLVHWLCGASRWLCGASLMRLHKNNVCCERAGVSCAIPAPLAFFSVVQPADQKLVHFALLIDAPCGQTTANKRLVVLPHVIYHGSAAPHHSFMAVLPTSFIMAVLPLIIHSWQCCPTSFIYGSAAP